VPKSKSVSQSLPAIRRSIPRLLPIAPRLLRIPEAAAYIGATDWFVSELIRKNNIRYLILGKVYVLDVKELDLWIEREKLRQASGRELNEAS
jgi:excisionase family DNA binding protein